MAFLLRMKITIKEISAEDTWDIRHSVMWPNNSINYIKLPEDSTGIHFGLFKNNLLTAVVSLFIKQNTAQFRKLATETQEQGKGYVSLLIKHIMKYAKNENVDKIWCNARAEKAVFYEKFQLVKTNYTYRKNGIDFIIMEKKLNSSNSLL